MFGRKHNVSAVSALLGGSLLVACGGGGGDPEPVQVGLRVNLVGTGTQLACSASRPAQVQLTRKTASGTSVETVACPMARTLAGDFVLSEWEAAPLPLQVQNGVTVGAVRVLTTLPPPVVLRNGEQALVLPNEAVEATGEVASIERVDAEGRPLDEVTWSGKVTALAQTAEPSQWRWTVRAQNASYQSMHVPLRDFVPTDHGYWGAMALAEPAGDNGARLFPADRHPGLPPGQFTWDRVFRDIRYADLDGDGRTDIVSNVYGAGCTMFAFARADGTYEVAVPLGTDDQCIGGHGETILTADFDGDGQVDVFLPTYERFYLLLNQGGRRFVETAESAGIAFPDYTPRVEGAAAVDIDLDGDVDIVAASEVLLNDGRGHFQSMVQPFGPSRVFDEGMSVADVDVDGRWDIVKHDPEYGPRIFWGNLRGEFDDAGWLFGGQVVSNSANGVAVGDLTGNRLPDLLLAGGREVAPAVGIEVGATGEGPRLCMQIRRREFECLQRFVEPIPGAWSDLLMVTDVDGDGANELVARYGNLITYAAAPMPGQHAFRFDVRDASGRRNQFGRTLTVRCDVDDRLLGMRAVDGGNGFMAQRDYVLNFVSNACEKVRVEVAGPSGPLALGSFEPGLHELRVPTATR
jgi:hypothetical protein